KMGILLHQKLKSLEHPAIGCTAGLGLLAGMEFVQDRKTKRPFSRTEQKAEGLVAAAFEKGLTLWPNVGHANGTEGDLVVMGPPLVIEPAHIDEFGDKLKQALDSFFV